MLIGKRINERYKIIELIGGGGMSHVYLAEDMILNREVAIKILRYDFSNEIELQRRFQREALAATTLAHPNIVSIYDVGNDADYHFIVMEYIKGKTLKQYIQQNSPISPAKAVQIMKQLTSAIAHAHDHQIIHRDIKPQNILVDEQGNVKITDFGIATTLSATSYTKTNSVIGTVHYLSPEQARGGIASYKSDVYALGIVLYEMLTGELPFSGESAVSIALKHLQSETPSVRAVNASIPQSLENVVIRATEKDPNYRYDSVQDMHHDLETVLSITRVDEPKYTIPADDPDKTITMPVVKEPPKILPIEPKPVAEIPKEKISADSVDKKPKKKRKKWPFIVIAIILLATIGVITYAYLNPAKYEVPSVKDLTVEEATERLEDAGFVVGDVVERVSEDVEKDKIIEQTPKAGIEKIKGTEIDLVVSVGPEAIALNDYTGKQIDQIQSMLKEFKGVEIVEVNSKEPVGKIIEQTPAAGTEIIPRDTVIQFTISKGVRMVEVSNLTNYTEADIKDYEKSSGFVVKVADEEHSETIPEGSVISQTPKAGTSLEEGSTIQVVVSEGPEEKAEQLYAKEVTIPYDGEEGAEQTIRVYINDKTHSMVDVFEEFTITSDKKYVITLKIVEGEKGAYQILKDNSVILQDTILYED